jgi:hypothetical protein
MSKLPAAQEDVIDSSLSKEDVPTNDKIVSNPLGSVDNVSIDQAQNFNRNIKTSKRKELEGLTWPDDLGLPGAFEADRGTPQKRCI